jgi:dephospho-CoA kinase
MLAVGVSGGIGSGKSTVADLLVERGAALIDADQVARDLVAPGMPVLDALVERFGPSILADDGTLDRLGLAQVTFGDEEALAALNAITHPAIGLEMVRLRSLYVDDARVVLFAIPLLRAEHRSMMDLDLVVVVDCPVEVTLERLVAARGMDRQDAARRITAQMDRTERIALADRVVDNAGSYEALKAATLDLWTWLEERCAAKHQALRG